MWQSARPPAEVGTTARGRRVGAALTAVVMTMFLQLDGAAHLAVNDRNAAAAPDGSVTFRFMREC